MGLLPRQRPCQFPHTANSTRARALAAPPRAVTIQIDPPPTGGSQWDLCFWISTGEEGESFEEQCFDSDARREAGQYWKAELEQGHHVLRFEGQTAAAGWSWTLHDGKVHAPLPADAESFYEKEEDETKLDSLLNERNQSAAALRTQLLFIRCKLLARYLSPARLPSSSAAHRSSGHPAEAREAPRAPSQGLAPLPATAARPVKEEPQRFEYRLSVEDDDDWTGSRKPSPGGAESSGDSAADPSMEYPRSGMKPEREMHDPYACLFSDDEVEL